MDDVRARLRDCVSLFRCKCISACARNRASSINFLGARYRAHGITQVCLHSTHELRIMPRIKTHARRESSLNFGGGGNGSIMHLKLLHIFFGPDCLRMRVCIQCKHDARINSQCA